MQLKDKVAIVTGGAGGLGLAMVEALLKKGGKVSLLDINATRGKTLLSSLQEKYGDDHVIFNCCDVSDEVSFNDAFNAVVSKYGSVDIMVNNAAIVDEKKDIDKMLLVNLGGTIRGSNLAIKHMRRDEGGKGGVIVNVSSIAGVEPRLALPSYVSTKHGVAGFTRSLATNPYLETMGLRFGLLFPFSFKSFIFPNLDEQLLYPKEHMTMLGEDGFEKVENIAQGLIEILEDDGSNGVMLFTHPTEGHARKKIQVVTE